MEHLDEAIQTYGHRRVDGVLANSFCMQSIVIDVGVFGFIFVLDIIIVRNVCRRIGRGCSGLNHVIVYECRNIMSVSKGTQRQIRGLSHVQ